jgi:hypothetical protein
MGMGAGGRFGGGGMMQQAQMGGYGMDEGYGGETRSVTSHSDCIKCSTNCR